MTSGRVLSQFSMLVWAGGQLGHCMVEKCSKSGLRGTEFSLTMICMEMVLSLTLSVLPLGLETSTSRVWCPVEVMVAGTLWVKLPVPKEAMLPVTE